MPKLDAFQTSALLTYVQLRDRFATAEAALVEAQQQADGLHQAMQDAWRVFKHNFPTETYPDPRTGLVQLPDGRVIRISGDYPMPEAVARVE